MKKIISEYIRILALALILASAVGVTYAWTGPTGAPPTNNVSGIINTSAADQVKSGGLWIKTLLTDGNVGVGLTAVPTERLDINGNAKATAFLYASDARLKENVQPFGGELDNVLKLQPVSFDWKSNGKSDIGFIAQEVEQVLPEIVHTNNETGLKSIDYPKLVVYLVQALKEQQKEIEQLKAGK